MTIETNTSGRLLLQALLLLLSLLFLTLNAQIIAATDQGLMITAGPGGSVIIDNIDVAESVQSLVSEASTAAVEYEDLCVRIASSVSTMAMLRAMESSEMYQSLSLAAIDDVCVQFSFVLCS